MARTIGTQKSIEGFMMRSGNVGQSFYSERKAKDITAIASVYKRKVSTESVIVMSYTRGEPEAKKILLVTILE
jgi:hypothetical protein